MITVCTYPDCQKDSSFQLGIAYYNKKSPEQIIGFICADHMRTSIENVMSQCIGTNLWVVVCDAKCKIIYHSYEADKKGLKAAYGWELYQDSLIQNNLIVCSYCETDPGLKPGSETIWNGFFDKDTNQNVCWKCKQNHYAIKFMNTGTKGLYSEFPVQYN